MGLRGPLPKPTAIKQAQGNPGKRRLNDGEPLPPPGEISPPAWLGARGREVWDQVAPVAIAMRVLTTADVLAFARYCEAFARYVELKTWLAKNGTTFAKKNPKGKVVWVGEFPQAIEFRRWHEILIRLENNFGLTPAARARLNVEASGAASTLPPPATPEEAKNRAIEDFFSGGGPAAPRTPPPAPPGPRAKKRGA